MSNKYLIAKTADIEHYLSVEQQQQLGDLMREIARRRILEGKRAFNEYWVVNKDEPYSEQVRELIGCK